MLRNWNDSLLYFSIYGDGTVLSAPSIREFTLQKIGIGQNFRHDLIQLPGNVRTFRQIIASSPSALEAISGAGLPSLYFMDTAFFDSAIVIPSIRQIRHPA